MYPTISLGPLVIPTAGLIYIIGAWLVLSIVERVAAKLELEADKIYGLSALMLAAGFIGARIIFVVLHWSAFRENLVGIVWPLTSGYNLWGGLILGITAGFFYGRARQVPPLRTLDTLMPGILSALLIISLADFAGGPGYGAQTNLPWGIDVFGIKRHPVQLYEILSAILALLVWWWGFRNRVQPGQMFLMAVVAYAAGRLFVDAYRANTPLTADGYHIVQIIALAILLLAGFALSRMLVTDPDLYEQAESS
jgi:phosphatidylglycerol:prolipoprotein diacylglycerol transferase